MGNGFAAGAATAALHWFDDAHPGRLAVLSPQLANTTSLRVTEKLGLAEVERFEDYGATRWLGVRRPPATAV